MRQFKIRPAKYAGDTKRPYEIVYVNRNGYDSAFVAMSKAELAQLAKEIINIISKP